MHNIDELANYLILFGICGLGFAGFCLGVWSGFVVVLKCYKKY